MYPWIQFPGLSVGARSHSVLLTLAVITSATLAYRLAVREEGLQARRVLAALWIVGAVTLGGGRLHYVLANWSAFRDHAWSTILGGCGLHAPGAVLGMVVGGTLVLALLRLPVGRFLDALATAGGVGIALARVGCFLHGCCFGTVCPHPWGVTFPRASSVFSHHVSLGLVSPQAAAPLPVHPLQLYFAAAGLGISALLAWWRLHRRFPGELAILFVLLFSASSAALEWLRDDQFFRVYWGPLPQLVWITTAMTLVSAGFLAVARSR